MSVHADRCYEYRGLTTRRVSVTTSLATSNDYGNKSKQIMMKTLQLQTITRYNRSLNCAALLQSI